jgi:hypothetical protein
MKTLPESRLPALRLELDLLEREVSPADIAKQAVKLVDGEHRRCRIIDRLRQGSDRYIDDDSQRADLPPARLPRYPDSPRRTGLFAPWRRQCVRRAIRSGAPS